MATSLNAERSKSSESLPSRSSPSHSPTSVEGGGVGGGDSKEDLNGGNSSPKLPITSRIFGRTRSSSTKEDSDDQSITYSAESSDKEKQKKEKSSWQFFGTPKAKSGTGWLPFSFAMTHREKNKEIHIIFKQLPASEKLIDDYSCALQRDILIHGRLYLTQNWLCFYANIFSWETLLTIPLTTVTSITKERTALLIPNAILISTSVEKYGFSSLIQRDLTYNIIFKVWQNSLLDKPADPLELVKAARKTWGDSTEVGSSETLWGPEEDTPSTCSNSRTGPHSLPTYLEIGQVSTAAAGSNYSSMPPPLSSSIINHTRSSSSLRQSSVDQLPPPVETRGAVAGQTMATLTVTEPIPSATAVERHTRGAMSVISDNTQTSTETGSTEVVQSSQIDSSHVPVPIPPPRTKGNKKKEGGGVDAKDSAASSGEFEASCFPDDQGEVSCGCTEHNGRTILNEVFNCDVETTFQLLFTDSDFFRGFLKARKTTNLEIGDWYTQADGAKLRDITYTLSLNYSFGPKYSPCTEHQVYSKIGQPGVRHIVSTEVVNSNIPYGDTFYVSCLFCMTRVAHNKTRVRVTSNICFKKNCWGVVKNLIERNAGDGLRSYYNQLESSLKEYLVNLPAKRIQKTRRTSRRRAHRRQPSPNKVITEGIGNKNEEEASVRKRRGSVSSRQSLKSLQHKLSEEDTISSLSVTERKTSNFRSIPKVNIALSILLSLLILLNIGLYHQFSSYQPPPSSVSSSSLSTSSSFPQPTLLPPDSLKEWPVDQQEWVQLVQNYWKQKENEETKLRQILKDIHDAMEQVEVTIHRTRMTIDTHLHLDNTTKR